MIQTSSASTNRQIGDDDVEQQVVEILDLLHHRRGGRLEARSHNCTGSAAAGRPDAGHQGGRRRADAGFPQEHERDLANDGRGGRSPPAFQILGGDLEGLSP